MLQEGAQYALRLLEGAIRYAEQHPGIELLESGFRSGHLPKWLGRRPECDGFLLWVGAGERWVERLLDLGLPAVNTAGGWPVERLPVVAFSGNGVLRVALDYLGGLGRATVGMVLYNQESDPESGRLRDAFVSLATQRGLGALSFDAGQQKALQGNAPRLTARGQEHLRAFLRSLPLPAALWAKDDFMGYATVESAQAIGLHVPDQLAVLGLGDYTVAHYCRPHLSSIPQPGDLIGFEALRVLDGLMAGRELAKRLVAIPPPPVVVRESTRGAGSADDRMRHIHDFLVEHACRGIKVDDLLRLAGVSLPTLHKQFGAVYGRTPGAEIRRVKVERAQHYLRTTALTVTRVAELCGYNQYRKFVNFFKRELGQTPSAYRAAVDPERERRC